MKEIEISDWQNFNEILDNYFPSQQQNLINSISCRGQADSSWSLETSLTRLVTSDNLSRTKAKSYEIQSISEFKSIYHLTNEKTVFSDGMDKLANLIDMQHYSCPTRLLDWSSSPFVALYFAINDNFNKDGAVYIWDYNNYSESCKKQTPTFKDLEIDTLINLTDFEHVQIALPTKKNERIYKQQGVFSVSNNLLKPHCEIIDNLHLRKSTESSLSKLTIPKHLKLEFLNRLKFMNITANTLMPGLDGIGKEIKESLLIRQWNKK
jgi:hypothetical protein